ncbi:MAG TPA: hypothetical protein PKB10_15370, partial [Tepidisphaeraceae bacterium]|nr:hypothetical protein [Tepidisphaeraceae bacterium]
DDLVAIDARLAVPDLNDDKRAKLVKERELIVQSIRERTESRDREISEQEARLLGWPRKIEYELYRVYGG